MDFRTFIAGFSPFFSNFFLIVRSSFATLTAIVNRPANVVSHGSSPWRVEVILTSPKCSDMH